MITTELRQASISSGSSSSSNRKESFSRQSVTDLTTSIKLTKGDVPPALVGASITVLNHHIYVFGGRIGSSRQMTNQLYILNLSTLEWQKHLDNDNSFPTPRYFHTSTAYADRYIIIFGGMGNLMLSGEEDRVSALDDICILDTKTMCWLSFEVKPSLFIPTARYAHIATLWDSHKLVILGGQDLNNHHIQEINVFDLEAKTWIYSSSVKGSHDAYRTMIFSPTLTESFFSPVESKQDTVFPVCMYSNYNFSDIQRELFCLYPTSECQQLSQMANYSTKMKGIRLPPGLRFPTGHLVGQHFIVSGTYLSSNQRSFQIWDLDLKSLTWSPIDGGHQVMSGSWNRGLLSNDLFFILGHSKKDLKDDYSHRRTNFEHVAVIELQAFGIYTKPPSIYSSLARDLGLSLLNNPGLGDVMIWTSDRQSILVNSTILADRWPGYAKLLENQKDQDDPTSRNKKVLFLPETYSVTMAFLQFLYTDQVKVEQQGQPFIQCRLLILADMYNLKRLRELALYALHQTLSLSTANAIYETATLCLENALQARALRVMIHAKRVIQMQYRKQQESSEHLVLSPSTSNSSGSYFSDSEPLSPILSVHQTSFTSLRKLSGMSTSSSEKIQHNYSYNSIMKSPQFHPVSLKKNVSTLTSRT